MSSSAPASNSSVGTVELGGTKTLVGWGSHPDDLDTAIRIPTGEPLATLQEVVEFLTDKPISAVGVASFGPIQLDSEHPDYGEILSSSPKVGWRGIGVVSRLGDGLGVPVEANTDVVGAAMAEGRWGACRGLTSYVYITVGTGIGGGAVVNGEPISGLGHPEMGHIVVERRAGDSYPGRCPHHGDCLEGMASGPALAERFGDSEGDVPERVSLVAFYLAQVMRDITYILAPQRIVIGGGVSHMVGFHDSVRDALRQRLAGYPGWRGLADDDYLTAPGLGDRSGLAGGLLIAQRALATEVQ
ncbi:MAG: ROK family protein [Acidimicrobiia bacterium]